MQKGSASREKTGNRAADLRHPTEKDGLQRGGEATRNDETHRKRRRKAKTTATTGTDSRQFTQKQKTVFKRKAQRQHSGTGDTERSIFAGMRAAVVLSIRGFLFRGVGKAN
jgi:hypothetical protein